MLQFITVEVDQATLRISSSKAVTGLICLKAGETSFPENKWNDFVIVLLTWWFESLLDVQASRSPAFELSFMDGPFLARGCLIDKQAISMEFVEGRARGERLVFTAEGTLDTLQNSMIGAAEETIRAVELHGWQARDLGKVKELLSEARTRWRIDGIP